MMKAVKTNATRREHREGPHLCSEFRGCSTRQRHDTRKTTRRSPFTPRMSRTLHIPASRCAENNERVVTYAQSFEDALRASAPTCRKQRDIPQFCPEFRGRSMRQRHDTTSTPRRSPLMPRISGTLYAASRRAENNERVVTYTQSFEDALYEPASRRADRPSDCLPSKQQDRRAWLTRATPRKKKNTKPKKCTPHKITRIKDKKELERPYLTLEVISGLFWGMTAA